jgi:hypothetical protein
MATVKKKRCQQNSCDAQMSEEIGREEIRREPVPFGATGHTTPHLDLGGQGKQFLPPLPG